MKSIYRWLTCHPKLAKLLIAIAVTIFALIFLNPKFFSPLIRYVIVFFMLFYGFLFVNTAPEKLIREPVMIWEQQCDPYPFLEELERQLPLCKENLQGQLTHINYAMILGQVGQYEKALAEMQRINIDRFPATAPVVKYIYYNNLCDTLTKLERFDEAEIWYRKACQIYEDLPSNKLKQKLSYNVQMNEIEEMYREKDFSGALRKLSWLSCETQRSVMDAALLAARCNLALEEQEKAKEKLQYVIDHGNRLYCVDIAKELLNTMTESV